MLTLTWLLWIKDVSSLSQRLPWYTVDHNAVSDCRGAGKTKVVLPTYQLRNSFWHFMQHLTNEGHLFLSWLPCLCRSVLIWSASSSGRAGFNFSWQRLFKWGNASSVFNLALLSTEHDKSAQKMAFKSAQYTRDLFISSWRARFFCFFSYWLVFLSPQPPHRLVTTLNLQKCSRGFLKSEKCGEMDSKRWAAWMSNELTEHGNITLVKMNQEIAPLI